MEKTKRPKPKAKAPASVPHRPKLLDMEWQDVSDADLSGALAIVKHHHDPVAARNLIEYFYDRIHNKNPYNERVLLEYLDHAFGKVIKENQSADHAFGLKLGRGKYRRGDTSVRDISAAAYMILLMREDWPWEQAKLEAANWLFPDGKGEKAVEKAYATHKALWTSTNEILKEMLPPGTPVIKRYMTG